MTLSVDEAMNNLFDEAGDLVYNKSHFGCTSNDWQKFLHAYTAVQNAKQAEAAANAFLGRHEPPVAEQSSEASPVVMVAGGVGTLQAWINFDNYMTEDQVAKADALRARRNSQRVANEAHFDTLK